MTEHVVYSLTTLAIVVGLTIGLAMVGWGARGLVDWWRGNTLRELDGLVRKDREQ